MARRKAAIPLMLELVLILVLVLFPQQTDHEHEHDYEGIGSPPREGVTAGQAERYSARNGSGRLGIIE